MASRMSRWSAIGFSSDTEGGTTYPEDKKSRRISKSLDGLRNHLQSLHPKGISAPTGTTLSRLKSCTSSTSPAKPSTSFRFLDLPDELQLKILSYSFKSRLCQIKDPVNSETKIKYRHNPIYLCYYSPPIPIAQVSRKLQDMTHEFYPLCFTYTYGGKSDYYPIRFNFKLDILVMPQWLLETPTLTLPALSHVKNLIITCTTRTPSPVAITRLSTLSPTALVQYINAGIWKYDSSKLSTLMRRERIITSRSPYWIDDCYAASHVRRGLRKLAGAEGMDNEGLPTVTAARISSLRFGREAQKGWWYLRVKQWRYRRIVGRFEEEERGVEREVLRVRMVEGDGV